MSINTYFKAKDYFHTSSEIKKIKSYVLPLRHQI